MDNNYRVETIATLAQWKVGRLGESPLCSDPFVMGIWDWSLQIHKDHEDPSSLVIKLVFNRCHGRGDQWPKAEFKFQYCIITPERQLQESTVYQAVFKKGDHFVWKTPEREGEFLICVEFLDLIMYSDNGEERYAKWRSVVEESAHERLSRILRGGIFTDLQIKVSDGVCVGHKAFLAVSSSTLKEKICDISQDGRAHLEIEEMSLQSFGVLLNYLYGIIQPEEFCKHHSELLKAAKTFNISDLERLSVPSINDDEACLSWTYVVQSFSLMRLSRLLEDQRHVDLKVMVGGLHEDKSETVIGVQRGHKAVFAASSDSLDRLFQYASEKDGAKVMLPNSSNEACRVLLNFLYGKISLDDPFDHMPELLVIADLHNFVDLRQSLEKYITHDLTNENILNRLNLAWVSRLHDLERNCYRFLFDFGRIHQIIETVAPFLAEVKPKHIEEFIKALLKNAPI